VSTPQDALDRLLSNVPPAPRAASSPAITPEVGKSRVKGLEDFVTSSGFEMSPGRSGYATGGHNKGSLHGYGYAADVRVRDRKPEDVEAFIQKAREAGYIVRDERVKPAGQAVWDGPHVHLEYDDLGKVLADIPAVDPLDAVLSQIPARDRGPANYSTNSIPFKNSLPDEEDVVKIASRDAEKTALPQLPQRPVFDVQTMEGRQARDARKSAEASPNARLTFDVPLPQGKKDWSEVSSEEASNQAARTYATSHQIPTEYVEGWLKSNPGHIYERSTGERKEPTDYIYEGSPFYDFERRTLRVSSEMPRLKKLEDDYKASKGTLTTLKDWATSDETSPGEKFVDVATPVVKGGLRTLDIATRPLQAVDAAFWARLRGADELGTVVTAYQQFFGDQPELGKSIIAEALRNSDRLKAINPKLPLLLGELANMIVEPSNLIPLGAAAELAKGGRLGRAGEAIANVGREAGLLDRGAVAARPLGLVEEASSLRTALEGLRPNSPELPALENRLSNVLEVTRKLKAGEELTPEEAALHAEVRAKYATPNEPASADQARLLARAGKAEAEGVPTRENVPQAQSAQATPIVESSVPTREQALAKAKPQEPPKYKTAILMEAADREGKPYLSSGRLPASKSISETFPTREEAIRNAAVVRRASAT
jgi:hypothetical protein